MIKREYIIERHGKEFVLYAGLLDLAHMQGLKAIRTTLIQAPTDANGMVAIVHAEVETEKGVFSGLGDASPRNVNQGMVAHLIRLAETRAKARALRDAVNVGAEISEDTGDEVIAPAAVSCAERVEVVITPGEERVEVAQAAPAAKPGGMITPAQIGAIYALARKVYRYGEAETDEMCRKSYGAPVRELSRAVASQIITALQNEIKRGNGMDV